MFGVMLVFLDLIEFEVVNFIVLIFFKGFYLGGFLEIFIMINIC